MELGLEGHTAVVTASSSGLGKATAEVFAREGANVVICSRSEENLAEAREDVEAAGPGEVLSVPTDLTEQADIEELVSTCVDEFGGIDHLVISVGRVQFGPFEDLAFDDWYDAFDVLVMSAVRTIREAKQHLMDSDTGTVVTITSASVAEPMENLTLSNSVRRAVLGLTKSLADELAPAVRINSVLPYHHFSPEDLAEYDDETTEGFTSDIPLERVGEPAKFGDVCVFLSSERADFIHGASIPLDGGWLRS